MWRWKQVHYRHKYYRFCFHIQALVFLETLECSDLSWNSAFRSLEPNVEPLVKQFCSSCRNRLALRILSGQTASPRGPIGNLFLTQILVITAVVFFHNCESLQSGACIRVTGMSWLALSWVAGAWVWRTIMSIAILLPACARSGRQDYDSATASSSDVS